MAVLTPLAYRFIRTHKNARTEVSPYGRANSKNVGGIETPARAALVGCRPDHRRGVCVGSLGKLRLRDRRDQREQILRRGMPRDEHFVRRVPTVAARTQPYR